MRRCVPATLASSQSTTGPTTQVPALPKSTWQISSEHDADADDAKVTSLLSRFAPLRADKFDESPSTRPATTYTIDLTTTGPGGTPVTHHHLTIADVPAPGSPQATYNGLSFELPRMVLDAAKGEFKKPAPGAAPAPVPAEPQMP